MGAIQELGQSFYVETANNSRLPDAAEPVCIETKPDTLLSGAVQIDGSVPLSDDFYATTEVASRRLGTSAPRREPQSGVDSSRTVQVVTRERVASAIERAQMPAASSSSSGDPTARAPAPRGARSGRSPLRREPSGPLRRGPSGVVVLGDDDPSACRPGTGHQRRRVDRFHRVAVDDARGNTLAAGASTGANGRA